MSDLLLRLDQLFTGCNRVLQRRTRISLDSRQISANSADQLGKGRGGRSRPLGSTHYDSSPSEISKGSSSLSSPDSIMRLILSTPPARYRFVSALSSVRNFFPNSGSRSAPISPFAAIWLMARSIFF